MASKRVGTAYDRLKSSCNIADLLIILLPSLAKISFFH